MSLEMCQMVRLFQTDNHCLITREQDNKTDICY